MKVIHKYTLAVGVNVLSLPNGTKFLSVQMQGTNICLWAEVSVTPGTKTRRVSITAFGTGGEVPSGLTYIGTVQEYEYVWHFYHD